MMLIRKFICELLEPESKILKFRHILANLAEKTQLVKCFKGCVFLGEEKKVWTKSFSARSMCCMGMKLDAFDSLLPKDAFTYPSVHFAK